MNSIQPLTRAAPAPALCTLSVNVLGKRRADVLDDDLVLDYSSHPDPKRAKGCAVLGGDANKENIPPFANARPATTTTAARRPSALYRRTSTGGGPGAAAAPSRLRRHASLSSSSAQTTSTRCDWASSLQLSGSGSGQGGQSALA